LSNYLLVTSAHGTYIVNNVYMLINKLTKCCQKRIKC